MVSGEAPGQHLMCVHAMAVCVCVHFPLPTNPLIPGDIVVFASCTQIVELNLRGCDKLQGMVIGGGGGLT